MAQDNGRLARSELERRLYHLLEQSAADGASQDDAVDSALAEFSAAQLRVMYVPVAEQRFVSIVRGREMQAKFNVTPQARGQVNPSDETDKAERAKTRGVEAEVAKMVDAARTAEERAAAYLSLGRTFLTGDGREIPILDATVEDFRARLSLLRRQQRGIQEGILLYQRILSDLVNAGVDTIRELVSAQEAAA